MISAEKKGYFYLSCDICHGVADKPFYSFMDAVTFKRENGWKSQKHQGEWEDVCPDCLESAG